MNLILDRYSIEYRSEIVSQLMTLIQQGHSSCVIGLAGVGKSNLVHFMEQPEVKQHYLPEFEASRTHVLPVMCLPGSQPKHELFEAMLVAAWGICNQLNISIDYAPPPGTSSFHVLRNTLRTLCQTHDQRIVYVFDEFESLIRYQSQDLFDSLRALRDDVRATRNIVYITITHRFPHLVNGNHSFGQGKLYEILRNHYCPLGPYRDSDTESMLDSLMKQMNPIEMMPEDRTRLIIFSGGHSSLLKAIFSEIYPELNEPPPKLLRLVRSSAQVRDTCERVWTHLHTEEQAALRSISVKKQVDSRIEDFLRSRGLINDDDPPRFFSPLFEEFIRDYHLQG